MSTSLPLMISALGGVALVLGAAYGVSTRSYRDAELAAFEKQVEVMQEARSAEAETASREAALADQIASLEASLAAANEALANATERAETAEARAVELAAQPVEEAAEAPELVVEVGTFGDAERGGEIFKQCASCHMVGSGAKDRVGPHLNGIFGRRAGSHDGYRYSDDMAMMGSDGLTWTLETLNAYMENPKALVSRTRMNFAGLEAPEDRADVLAFLRQYSDDPANIPEAAPTAMATDHDLAPEILALEGDAEYGEYLSSECLTCHKADGADDGIPSITYWPEADFVIAMHAYKRKLRPHPVMQMMAGRLNDEEIAALAAYFARIDE